MLSFSDKYFDGEVRDGFFIESKMKRAWAAQLEVLDEIRRICQANNIRYFADWGTLLGAVRHQGFVPWDDDLDICMLRDDYNRFLEIAPGQLSSYFELKSIYNNPTHDNVKCRIITGRSMNFSPEYLNRFHECPYIVGVDIFPVDYIPSDETEAAKLLESIEFVMTAAASLPEDAALSDEEKLLVQSIESAFNIHFNPDNRLFHELKKLVDILSSSVKPECSHEVCSMIDLAGGWDYHIPVEWYGESIDMPFENTTIPVPAGYDGILRVKYGDDYMTPVQGFSSHDYPFYRGQEQALKEVIEKEFNTQITEKDLDELISAKIAQAMSH